jgi:pilus assembly protein CpaC
LSVTLSNQTIRIPGLGDLPYIGPFFSNTTGDTIEKELLVLVTPSLVEPKHLHQKPLRPGDEVYEPNDLEFYLFGRLEGHTGHSEFRSTTVVDDPFRRMSVECSNIQGPIGFSE